MFIKHFLNITAKMFSWKVSIGFKNILQMFKSFKYVLNVYWVVITLCHNSWKSDARRTYALEKGKRTCVLLTIGEQEREIQNAQVLSMSSKSGDKRTCVWAKAKP